jgi:hypothetical protein
MLKKPSMFYKLILIFSALLLFSCTNKNKKNIVGKWQLTEVKNICNAASLQIDNGTPVSSADRPKIVFVFFPDSTFKKTTEEQAHYWSADDNLEGRYQTTDSSIQLIVGSSIRETLHISEVTDNKLVFIFKNSVINGNNPAEKCDLFHYYEK